MSFAETALLGAIAGFTIFLGLPIGRAQRSERRAPASACRCCRPGSWPSSSWTSAPRGSGSSRRIWTPTRTHDASLWPVIGLFALLSAGFLAGVGGIATVAALAAARRERPAADRRRRVDGRDEPRRAAPSTAGVRGARAHGAAHRDGHRGRDRAAQLRGGPGHRRLRPGRRDRPRDRADHRLRAAQLDRGLRHRRPARRRTTVLALARPRRPRRRRPDVPRRDGRLPGHQRRARALLLRARRRRDPLRDRRDLGRRAPPRATPSSASTCSASASCSASRPTSSSPTAAPDSRDALCRSLRGSRRQRSAGGGDPTP